MFLATTHFLTHNYTGEDMVWMLQCIIQHSITVNKHELPPPPKIHIFNLLKLPIVPTLHI